MPCFTPNPAYYDSRMTKAGKFKVIVVKRTEANLAKYSMRMPCGRCSHCRLKKSREWALRCMNEASLYVPTVDNPDGRGNCFITLTYNNEHMPRIGDVGNLVYRDFQLFLKRLRKRFGEGIRFYMCGEYGGKYGRPHFHALLFNHNFDFDKYFWKMSDSGFPLYRSPSLEELWSIDGRSIGYSSVADLNFDTAAYCARYVMKKITGDAALGHYAVFDEETGEIYGDRTPEFNEMSTRDGIGKEWFNRYCHDVYAVDSVIVSNTKKFPPPKYYDRQFELISPEDMARIKDKRVANIKKVPEERLKVMQRVKERQVQRLVRTMDKLEF